MNTNLPWDCIPVKRIFDENQRLIQWFKSDDLPFSEPFFDESIMRLTYSFPENQSGSPRCISSPEILMNLELEDHDPDGIVFHVSRCGSTLLSQLFGLHPELCSLAEVPLLDEFLADKRLLPESEAKNLFRSGVNLLRRTNKHLILKLDSWHLFHYETLRTYYPNVPFVLLYRNPVEVWKSHQKNPGMHAVPGLLNEHQLNFALTAVDYLGHPDTYFAALINAYFRQLIRILETDSSAKAINYKQGVVSMVVQSAAHFDLVLEEQLLGVIQQRSKQDAKKPNQPFLTEKHHSEVPDFLSESMELYQQLDALSEAKHAKKNATWNQ